MDLTARPLNARTIAIYVRIKQNVKDAMMDFISIQSLKLVVLNSANKIAWPAQVLQVVKPAGLDFLLIMVNARVVVQIATNVTRLIA